METPGKTNVDGMINTFFPTMQDVKLSPNECLTNAHISTLGGKYSEARVWKVLAHTLRRLEKLENVRS